MQELIEIPIKQFHIDTGIPGNCKKCPIALALSDIGFSDVVVGPEDIIASHPENGIAVYDLDWRGVYFIDKFDSGHVEDVSPCTISAKFVCKR